MRRARRTLFATPFVVTLAAGSACHPGGDPARLPTEPPVPGWVPPEPIVEPPSGKLHVHRWGEEDHVPPGTIVFVDPYCVLQVAEGEPWHEVDCPEDGLPDPRPEHLVIQDGEGGRCLEVLRDGDDRDHGDGRVRCPDTGPSAELPETTRIHWQDTTMRISGVTLRCSYEIYANPPYWKRVERCPPELLPRLINGTTPTDADEPCHWHEIEVRCPD